jgi:tRNA wybutosine-synthesizing protein 3
LLESTLKESIKIPLIYYAMMKDRFQNEKLMFFKKQDKSHKGRIDKVILKLIKKINSKQDCYTTSSCAGRIILLKEKDKKQKNIFLFVSHEKISFPELRKALNNAVKYRGLIYFQQEPCILHVVCSSLDAAKQLVKKARAAGWKKSGIILGRKITCELVSTECMALPIASSGKILLADSFLKLLIKEANKKLRRTREKIKKLEKLI